MSIKGKIQKGLKGLHACEVGKRQLAKAKTNAEIVACFWEYYQFCIRNNFPSADFWTQYLSKEAIEAGIYVNEIAVNLDTPRRAAFLGHSTANICFSGGGVAHIIVSDSARVDITLKDGFALFVDVLDNARVNIVAEDYSTLRVHRYGSSHILNMSKKGEVDYKEVEHKTTSYDNV